MASDTSCPECGEPISDGISECPKCAHRPAAEPPAARNEALAPAAKMTRTELVLSILLSAVFIGFCIYMLSENPLMGLILALVTGIISLTGWFLANVFRWLRNLLRRKKAQPIH